MASHIMKKNTLKVETGGYFIVMAENWFTHGTY